MELSYIQITIIVLICIGVFSCISGLIYTKIIKPNTFAYSSNAYVVKRTLKDTFKKLKNENLINKCYLDIAFNLDGMKLGSINYLFYAKQIYFVSSPLYWDVSNVLFETGEIYCETKKGKLTLPLDVKMFVNLVKKMRKDFGIKSESKIVIPCLNKSFETISLNNIEFVSTENLHNWLKENINSSTEDENTKLKFKKIVDQGIFPKAKRGILKPKNVSEI